METELSEENKSEPKPEDEREKACGDKETGE